MVKYYRDALDYIYFALSDSTRRSILERLAQEGDLKVTTLAEPFDMSLPAISKHLRVLERAGLMVQEKDGRVRRCQLVAEPLEEAADWIEQYRQFWETQFDSLASYLNQVQAQDEKDQNGE
jgi:DNA-binding transcriptional ArsR family regulator